MFAVYMGATMRGKVFIAIGAMLCGLLQLLLHLRSLEGSSVRRNGEPSFVRVCFAFFIIILVESAGGLSSLVQRWASSLTVPVVEGIGAVRSENSEHTTVPQVVVVIDDGLAATLQVSKKLKYSCAALKTHSVWGFR